jgi:hypothetical protein
LSQEYISQDDGVSLSQRAYVIAKSLRGASRWLLFLVVGILFFNILALSATYLSQTKTIRDLLTASIIISAAISCYIVGWFLVKAPHAYKRLEEWNEDYLHHSYFINFQTTIPKGNISGEKVLNLAKLVFPELRSDLYISLLDSPNIPTFISGLTTKLKKKVGKSDKEDISENFDYKVDAYSFDLVLKNKALEGYFIVKDFRDKVVTLGDLQEMVKVIHKEFGNKIFRTICVAKRYDQSFFESESLEKHMTQELKVDFKIDLLVEEDVGYSVLWIG